MVGTPGSGPRRDNTGAVASHVKTPGKTVVVKTPTSGRSTPVRTRPGDANFTTSNGTWGFETPTNKILAHVPVTVTNRSSERRRRIRTDGSDTPEPSENTFGSGFVDARAARVKTPVFDSVASRTRERSGSTSSAKSENAFQPRKLAKVSSFCSERPGTTPLQPSTKKDNFFHAKDVSERSPSPAPSGFFFAAKNGSTTVTAPRPRRLSNSSQFSSFSTAKEVGQRIVPTDLPPILPSSTSHQLRSPVSPTKTSFFQSSNSETISPTTSTFPKRSPPHSPLRSTYVAQHTPSPPPKESPTNPPEDTSRESSSSSSPHSTALEVSTDTSSEEEDLTTKSLLPTTTSDLENSARVNRKVSPLLHALLTLDRGPRNLKFISPGREQKPRTHKPRTIPGNQSSTQTTPTISPHLNRHKSHFSQHRRIR